MIDLKSLMNNLFEAIGSISRLLEDDHVVEADYIRRQMMIMAESVKDVEDKETILDEFNKVAFKLIIDCRARMAMELRKNDIDVSKDF